MPFRMWTPAIDATTPSPESRAVPHDPMPMQRPVVYSLSFQGPTPTIAARPARAGRARDNAVATRIADDHSRRQARRAAPGRARVPRVPHAGQDRGHADQAADQPARPGPGVFAGRRRGLRGDRRRSRQRVPLHRARQSRGRRVQRHRGAGPGQHRPAGVQAGDGGQGRPVQEVRRHRRVRHRDRRRTTSTSWSTASPRWSPPSAASTSRTSRRPTASTSSASCASA